MQKIAVLLTCHNRINKTLNCLESLSTQSNIENVVLEYFIVDDGSSDNTFDILKNKYPDYNIIKGNGSLFWAGGMRLAWETALKVSAFDYFLLVNDDTILYNNAISELMIAVNHSITKTGKNGLYVGSTIDPVTKEHSYGGQRLKDVKDYASFPVKPNGEYQNCHLCNANILLVSLEVTKEIGILSTKYTHSIADYDYSMQAITSGFPIWVLPDYSGECLKNKGGQKFYSLNFNDRLKFLYSPKGFSYKEFIYFTKKFFPSTYLKTIITLWIRVIFPSLWLKYKALKSA